MADVKCMKKRELNSKRFFFFLPETPAGFDKFRSKLFFWSWNVFNKEEGKSCKLEEQFQLMSTLFQSKRMFFFIYFDSQTLKMDNFDMQNSQVADDILYDWPVLFQPQGRFLLLSMSNMFERIGEHSIVDPNLLFTSNSCQGLDPIRSQYFFDLYDKFTRLDNTQLSELKSYVISR